MSKPALQQKTIDDDDDDDFFPLIPFAQCSISTFVNIFNLHR